MAVVDLRGRNQQQALQRMMYIQQFQASSGISGNEPSNVERVMSDIEKTDLANKQYERQWEEGRQRMNIAQSEHERRLSDFDQVQAFRQKQEAFDQWKGTEDSKKNWAEYALREKETNAQIPLFQAQTEHAKAETGLTRTKTLGEQAENERKFSEGLVHDANTRRSMLIAKAARQGYLSPGDTDEFEGTERVIGANPHMQVDRNPDGTIAHPEKLPLSVLNKDGTPDATYAKGLRDVDAPYSDFGKILRDAREAKEAGAPPEILQHYEDKVWQITAPYAGQVEGFIAQQMIREHNIPGAMDYLNAARKASAPVVKLPDPRERIDYKGTIKMVQRLDTLTQTYLDLKQRNKFPVGYLKQPVWDLMAKMGNDDPEIQAFRMQMEQFRAKYTLFLSGRATTNEERADIQKQIPSIYNSFQTFEKALPDFSIGLKEDAAIDIGIAKSYGQKIPQGVPVIDPGEVLAKGGKLPQVLLEHGAYLASDAIKDHVQGQKVIGRRLAAQGVGGLAGNVRDDKNFYANYPNVGTEGVPVPEGGEAAPPPQLGETTAPYQDVAQAGAIVDEIRNTFKEHPELAKDYPELAAQYAQ